MTRMPDGRGDRRQEQADQPFLVVGVLATASSSSSTVVGVRALALARGVGRRRLDDGAAVNRSRSVGLVRVGGAGATGSAVPEAHPGGHASGSSPSHRPASENARRPSPVSDGPAPARCWRAPAPAGHDADHEHEDRSTTPGRRTHLPTRAATRHGAGSRAARGRRTATTPGPRSRRAGAASPGWPRCSDGPRGDRSPCTRYPAGVRAAAPSRPRQPVTVTATGTPWAAGR